MVRDVFNNEKLFIRGDLNGHVGTTRKRSERVYECFVYAN
jgi:hypothetical protein